jgi:hypothetical protein
MNRGNFFSSAQRIKSNLSKQPHLRGFYSSIAKYKVAHRADTWSSLGQDTHTEMLPAPDNAVAAGASENEDAMTEV